MMFEGLPQRQTPLAFQTRILSRVMRTNAWILVCLLPFLSGGVCKPTMLGGDPRVSDINVPQGFVVSVFADEVKNARELAYSPEGIVYAGSMDEGVVYAMPDKDHDGKADTVIVIARKLLMPVGVAWHNGDLAKVGKAHRRVVRRIRMESFLVIEERKPRLPSAELYRLLPTFHVRRIAITIMSLLNRRASSPRLL